MNIDHLRNFLEVTRDMNITAAARRLRLTQPALSRQMSVFENDTGWKLLERSAKAIRLTRHGEIVKRLGAPLIKSVDQTVARMRYEIEGDEIRIGYAPSLGGDLLKSAMSRFCQLHADARITLADVTSEEMLAGLKSGQFDLIIAVRNDDPAIAWTTLRHERFKLAMRSDHALATKRSVRSADLEGERMLLLSRDDYPGYWQEVTDYFRAQSINAKVAGEFDGVGSLRLGLEAGMGLAMVVARARMGEQVKLKDITPCPEPICVAAGIRVDAQKSPIMQVLIDELKIEASRGI